MKPEDKSTFGEMLRKVGAMYGKEKKDILEITPIYFSALMPYDIQDIRQALSAHIGDTDNGQFMPKPADIIRQIGGSKESNALLAWSKVEKAIRTVGNYKSVCFDDPVIHCAIDDMGGWIDLCSITEDELPFKQREFEKRYTGYFGRKTEHKPKLIGSIDADYSRRGIEQDDKNTVMIGDEQKAILTYQSGGETSSGFKTIADLTNEAVKRIEK